MTWILYIFIIPILYVGLFFILEVFTGLVQSIRPQKAFPLNDLAGADDIICTVLVPAHNEADVIVRTLSNIKADLPSTDRICVVADNCSDDTASLARNLNVEVVERINESARGKGYALAFGVDYISSGEDPPDVVIVLDADCTVNPDCLKILKYIAFKRQLPVQGRYMITSAVEATPQQKVSALAIYLKNYIRPLGLSCLGGGVPITGSGFAVPLPLLSTVDLNTGHIAEDMKLGCDLSAQGYKTLFAPSAAINSMLPVDAAAASKQRLRWEHGHLTILSLTPSLFKRFVTTGDKSAFLTASDMAIPPLTLLVMLLVTVVIALLIFPLKLTVLSIIILVTLLGAVFLSNLLAKPRLLQKRDVLGIIYFFLAKFGIYKAFFLGHRSSWVKTTRDSHPVENSERDPNDR